MVPVALERTYQNPNGATGEGMLEVEKQVVNVQKTQRRKKRRRDRIRFVLLDNWLEYDQNQKFYKPRKPSENSRHPDLEYDDQEPNEDGLGFSSYHVLEW